MHFFWIVHDTITACTLNKVKLSTLDALCLSSCGKDLQNKWLSTLREGLEQTWQGGLRWGNSRTDSARGDKVNMSTLDALCLSICGTHFGFEKQAAVNTQRDPGIHRRGGCVVGTAAMTVPQVTK